MLKCLNLENSEAGFRNNKEYEATIHVPVDKKKIDILYNFITLLIYRNLF